jgi:hypothetical protein
MIIIIIFIIIINGQLEKYIEKYISLHIWSSDFNATFETNILGIKMYG